MTQLHSQTLPAFVRTILNRFLKFIHLFGRYEYFEYMYVCPPFVCPWRSEEGTESPRTRIIGGYELVM